GGEAETTTGGCWSAAAVGDSCLFHIRGEEILFRFPLKNAEEFDNRPFLLGTMAGDERLIAERLIRDEGSWAQGDVLYLMTEAMQKPRVALADPELQAGQAEEDQLGLPRPITGGFASVYKVNCQSRTWAVRCFLRDFPDQQERYVAISSELAKLNFPFATHFQ